MIPHALNTYTLRPRKSVDRKPCLSHKHASRTTLFVGRSSTGHTCSDIHEPCFNLFTVTCFNKCVFRSLPDLGIRAAARWESEALKIGGPVRSHRLHAHRDRLLHW
jgi:hypothetical protein